jgi:hypothetical protein
VLLLLPARSAASRKDSKAIARYPMEYAMRRCMWDS